MNEKSRPKTRADCVDGPRPCPWVGCRYHTWGWISRQSGVARFVGQRTPPHALAHSCALDVAEAGGLTLEAVGEVLGISMERVRQIQESALRKLRGLPHLRALFDETDGEPIQESAPAARKETSAVTASTSYTMPPKRLGERPRLTPMQTSIAAWARYLFSRGEAPTVKAIAAKMGTTTRGVSVAIAHCGHEDYLWRDGALVYVRGMELFEASSSEGGESRRDAERRLILRDAITPEVVAQIWDLDEEESEALRFLSKGRHRDAIYFLERAKGAREPEA